MQRSIILTTALCGVMTLCGQAAAQSVASSVPALSSALEAAKKSSDFKGAIDTRKSLPKRLQKVELSPGTTLDFGDYLQKTRLTELPSLDFSAGVERELSIDTAYREEVLEFSDVLIVDRALTITYDPAACGTDAKSSAKGKAGLSSICLTPKSGKMSKEATQMVANMRKEIEAAPKGFTLPNGMSGEEARTLSDEELIRAYFNSGTVTYHTVSTVPKYGAAFLDQGDPAMRLAREMAARKRRGQGLAGFDVNDYDLGINEISEDAQEFLDDIQDAVDTAAETARDLNERLSTLNEDLRVDVKAMITPTFDPLIPDQDDFVDADEASRAIRLKKQREFLAENAKVTRPTGVTLDDFDPKDLVDASPEMVGEPDFGKLTPAQQEALLGRVTEERISLLGRSQNIAFLAGYSYTNEIHDRIGVTFYEGGRYTDPIFIHFNYWVNPYYGIRMPFAGNISSTLHYDRKIEDGAARYVLDHIDVPIRISGEDVDAQGRSVFQSVGLDQDAWFEGKEFAVGLNVDCNLHYDLPFDDDQWILCAGKGHYSFEKSNDFAPSLGGSRAKITDITFPFETTGLGISGWFGSAGVDVGVDLIGRDGILFIDTEMDGAAFYDLVREPSYFNGTASNDAFRIEPTAGQEVEMYPRSNPLLRIENVGYQVGLEIVPVVTPRLTVDLGVYEFNWSDPISFPSLSVNLGTYALPPHAGTRTTTTYEVKAPDPSGL